MEFIKMSIKVYSIHYEGIEETHNFIFKANSLLISVNRKFFYSMKKVVADKVANNSWNSNQIDVEFSFTPMTEAEVLAEELNSNFKGIASTSRICLDKNDPSFVEDDPRYAEKDTQYVKNTLEKSIDHIADRIENYQRDETLGV